jgi:hypothetical protein
MGWEWNAAKGRMRSILVRASQRKIWEWSGEGGGGVWDSELLPGRLSLSPVIGRSGKRQ